MSVTERRIVCAIGLAAGVAFTAMAQAPASPPQRGRGTPAPLAIPNPSYVSIPMEIAVDRPAADLPGLAGVQQGCAPA